MDAFEQYPENDVHVVPVSIVYDQQHEVSAISAEEMGGTKKPESVGWMYRFASSQSRRLGHAYVRFGEPLSLRDAVSLTEDEDGQPRPRLAVHKIAIETANRINAATPITSGALITFALLDNGDRAITVDEGREILRPLLEYINARGLPVTEELGLERYGVMRDTLDRLVGEGVVSVFDGGTEPVFWVELAKQHEAAFYRNTIVHFFVVRAIAELAALEAAEAGAEDINAEVWSNARRLKTLLRFEFFFPSSLEFAGEVANEITLIYPEWQGDTFTADDVLSRLKDLRLLVAHRVIGPILEAYSVLADQLAALGELPVDEKTLVARCLGVGQQRWLQSELPTAESISRDYFSNASTVASKLGLLESTEPGLAERRTAFAAELDETVRRLDELRQIAQAAGQPVLTVRAETSSGGARTNG